MTGYGQNVLPPASGSLATASHMHKCAEPHQSDTHQGAPVPSEHPRQREMRRSKLKQLKSLHLCLFEASCKYINSRTCYSASSRYVLSAVRGLSKAAVTSRAVNWIVEVRDRKMIEAFLQLPGFPWSTESRVRLLTLSLFVLLR